MLRKVRLFIVGALIAVALAIPQVALAAPPYSAYCWGKVTSQRATTAHDIGVYTSAQEEPCMGLGNTVRFFKFESVGELGSFLASVDGIPETSCP